jgi:hypothetical protein
MLGKQGPEHVHAKRNQSSHHFLAKTHSKTKKCEIMVTNLVPKSTTRKSIKLFHVKHVFKFNL